MTTSKSTHGDEIPPNERASADESLAEGLEKEDPDGEDYQIREALQLLGESKRILLGLGVLNLAFAAVRGYLGVTGVITGQEAAIDVFLVGGLGFLLVYYVSRLPRSEIHPETYSRIVARSLTGVVVMLAVLALFDLNPAGTIDEPVQVMGIALSLGSVGGYAIGVNEARALTRARDAERFAGEAQQHKCELEAQNERLESFASMLTHELRNPLTIAQIYLQQADPRDAEAAGEVEQALDRIEEMIDILLVTARTTDSDIDWKTVTVADATAEAWDDVSTESASLVVDFEQSIRADPIHLHHLLTNLFRNAIKHGGNEVTVTVGPLPAGFYVEDDGIGIPADKRDAVFDAGHTTHEDGIGLGLTFIAQLAETYDWECTIAESETGGARFEFANVDLVSADVARSD